MKYVGTVKDVYPLVYAVEIKPEWFKKFPTSDAFNIRAVDLASIADIPPGNIYGRVEYKNGVERWGFNTNSSFPLPWNIEDFNADKSNGFLI